MTLIHKTYQCVYPLGRRMAADRVEKLLSLEGVKYVAIDGSIASTRTPIAVLGIQPALYTSKNWVGINPFTCISGVEIKFEAVEDAVTRLTVRINRGRALLIFMFWVACGFLTARQMPQPSGLICLTGLTIIAWFGFVSFFGSYLVRREIDTELCSASRL
jgi:hypothetical protein